MLIKSSAPTIKQLEYWNSLKGIAPRFIDNTGKRNSRDTEIKKGQRISPSTEFKRKGINLGYHGLHDWVYKKLGRPKKCENCGSENSLEWANKSLEYLEDVDDWISLCSHVIKEEIIN